MKAWIFSLIALFLSSGAHAQSATEYIELICAPKDYLAVIYWQESIEGVLESKASQVKFWNGIAANAEETIKATQTIGLDGVMKNPDLDAKAQAVFKACGAYGKMSTDISKYASNNKNECVDEKNLPWNFLKFGEICARWYETINGK